MNPILIFRFFYFISISLKHRTAGTSTSLKKPLKRLQRKQTLSEVGWNTSRNLWVIDTRNLKQTSVTHQSHQSIDRMSNVTSRVRNLVTMSQWWTWLKMQILGPIQLMAAAALVLRPQESQFVDHLMALGYIAVFCVLNVFSSYTFMFFDIQSSLARSFILQ